MLSDIYIFYVYLCRFLTKCFIWEFFWSAQLIYVRVWHLWETYPQLYGAASMNCLINDKWRLPHGLYKAVYTVRAICTRPNFFSYIAVEASYPQCREIQWFNCHSLLFKLWSCPLEKWQNSAFIVSRSLRSLKTILKLVFISNLE